MDGYKLGVVETRFAELIWQHEPLTSGELVKLLCEPSSMRLLPRGSG